MSQTILRGLNGGSPLGFMAAVGLLRVLAGHAERARLGFVADGTFRACLTGAPDRVAQIVANDAAAAAPPQSWLLSYGKEEKNRSIVAKDLKAPPDVFREFLQTCLDRWRHGDADPVAYAAAFGTSSAVDGKGNTKPTAFHFTAANMQFLEIAIDKIRPAVTAEWAEQSLFTGYASRTGSNLRWDPAAERNWALMASDPTTSGTSVDAPLEWLAFRGLPLFPTFPVQSFRGVRAATTGVAGRGDEMRFTWPLWGVPATVATVRSLLQIDWSRVRDRAERGIIAVCTSEIRRTAQGFGNFGPASISV